MKKFLLVSFAISSSMALAASTIDTAELQSLVDGATGLLPPEYLEMIRDRQDEPDKGLTEAFSKPSERADCKLGLRFGKQIANTVLTRLKPTCDKLLAPIGTEWIPPKQEERSDAFGRCFDNAFSWQASQIVYDTAELCGWSGFEGSLMAGQEAYNDCYLKVAELAPDSTLITDPYIPGKFALLPQDSARWESMLAGIRSTYGMQSGYIAMLCELGKADAEAGYMPSNILNRPDPT